MRIAIAQYNVKLGNIEANLRKLLDAALSAQQAGADLLVTAELALIGYLPGDLLDRPCFIQDAMQALQQLITQAPLPMLVGSIVGADDDHVWQSNGPLFNGAVLIEHHRVIACHRKMLLPSYDIFDEKRYFTAGRHATVAQFASHRIGISICEDMWYNDHAAHSRQPQRNPMQEQVDAGATCLINLSASPYDRDKPARRQQLLQTTARKQQRPILYVNQVGAHDSLIFDGRSMAADATGALTFQAPAFVEYAGLVHMRDQSFHGTQAEAPTCWQEDIVQALTLGLRDYVHTCGFERVVMGLSGGIDSAVSAALAVAALGARHVIGVAMPSRYSSCGATDDALQLARNLGIRCDTVSIEPMFQAYLDALHTPFGATHNITEENLQARIRGTTLMAYANQYQALLLTTGNKSEIATGYCTLYGDMNGSLGLLADLYKTDVYAIANYLNLRQTTPCIPQSSIDKAPSAELRPNQTDEASLLPYPLLDAILCGYIDHVKSAQQLVDQGFAAHDVARVINLVDRNEYKRQQMPIGLRISSKAFGRGRRLPITQTYKMHLQGNGQ